jgi:hypothetical protein
VLLHESKKLVDQGAEPDRVGDVVAVGAHEPVHQFSPGQLDVGDIESLLGAEVRIQHRLGHAGQVGDPVHGGVLEAVTGKYLTGDVENQGLPDRARYAPASSSVRLVRPCPARGFCTRRQFV